MYCKYLSSVGLLTSINLANSVKVIKEYPNIPPSKILRVELNRLRISQPPYKTAAKHIVAINDKNAKSARDILEKYKIELNSASNGVFYLV